MRILMISPQFYPIIGGYERFAERLSKVLAAKGHDVFVITERRKSHWPFKEEQSGVHIQRLTCLYHRGLHTLSSLTMFCLFLFLNGHKFDIWHIHQYGLLAVVTVLCGKVKRRPVVMKLTNTGVYGLAAVTAGLPLFSFMQFVLSKVDAVVALTRETRTEAIAFGYSKKQVHVIGNGTNIDQFKSKTENECVRLRNKLGINSDGILLYVGRMAVEKKVNGLIDAWKTALPNLPGVWKLVLIGDGPLKEELKNKVLHIGLQNTILFKGQQSNIQEWMQIADIFILSSTNEGLSNAMLEAMASGLPVISTRVSGTDELLVQPGAGKVVDVGHMDKLSESVINLANSPQLRKEMGRIGRAVIEERYSIGSVADRHAKLYQGLITRLNNDTKGC